MNSLFPVMIDTSSKSKIISESASGLFPLLSSSDIFKYADATTNINGERLSAILPKVINDSDMFHHISYSQLTKESQFKLLDSRTVRLRNKEQIKKAIEIGDIVLVYSETTHIPMGIPFILRKSAGERYVAYVMISEFSSINKDAEIEIINVNSVLAYVLSAYAAIKYCSYKLSVSKDAMEGLVITYAKMFSNIISANSSINDQEMKIKLECIGARFFMYRSAKDENEGDELYYRHVIDYYKKYLNKPILDGLEMQFPMESFSSFENLLLKLNEVYPGLKNTDLRSFVERWIRNYGPGAAFAIDYPGYMIFVILAVILNGTQVNTRTISNLLDKHYQDVFEDIEKL